MATHFARALLVGASALIGLIGAEFGLRSLGAYRPPPLAPSPARPDLYREDSELGYTLVPSTKTTYRYPPSSSRHLSLVSNADGFRNSREFDEVDSRRRFWVVGDSMVFGEGVEAEDRLTEVVERLEPTWRVDNLGMTGWGLDLMVRLVEKLVLRVKPEWVVLGFYTDDFRRLQPWYAGQGYPIPKFVLQGHRLTSVAFSPPPLWRRTHVAQAIEQNLKDPDRLDLNRALLERLRATSQDRFRLAVAFLPGRGDTPRDRRRRAWLRDWCASVPVPFLDLTDVLLDPREGPLHIPNNSHWNERGHRVAGEALHRFLRQIVQERPALGAPSARTTWNEPRLATILGQTP